jgi:hypothetical protein
MCAFDPSRLLRGARIAGGTLVLVLMLAACGGGESAAGTFDPAAPCIQDGQQPGAYPDLEALLPGTLLDRQPASIVSGRTCTPQSLGTLATHGVKELRFAGATWEEGAGAGFTVAVFEAAGLDAGQLVEFYQAGSKAARPGDEYHTSDAMVGGAPAARLDVTGADGSSQTVVAWTDPAGDGAGDGRVHALLAANLGEQRIADLLESLGGG